MDSFTSLQNLGSGSRSAVHKARLDALCPDTKAGTLLTLLQAEPPRAPCLHPTPDPAAQGSARRARGRRRGRSSRRAAPAGRSAARPWRRARGPAAPRTRAPSDGWARRAGPALLGAAGSCVPSTGYQSGHRSVHIQSSRAVCGSFKDTAEALGDQNKPKLADIHSTPTTARVLTAFGRCYGAAGRWRSVAGPARRARTPQAAQAARCGAASARPRRPARPGPARGLAAARRRPAARAARRRARPAARARPWPPGTPPTRAPRARRRRPRGRPRARSARRRTPARGRRGLAPTPVRPRTAGLGPYPRKPPGAPLAARACVAGPGRACCT